MVQLGTMLASNTVLLHGGGSDSVDCTAIALALETRFVCLEKRRLREDMVALFKYFQDCHIGKRDKLVLNYL